MIFIFIKEKAVPICVPTKKLWELVDYYYLEFSTRRLTKMLFKFLQGNGAESMEAVQSKKVE